MNVLLIRPHPGRANDACLPPIGLGYVAGYLRKHGLDPELWDLTLGANTVRGLKKRILNGPEADLIGIQVYSRDVYCVKEMFDALATILSPKTVVAIGGPHPTVAPEHSLRYFNRADVVFIGEAERSFAKMAIQLREQGSFSKEDLAGIAWMEGDEVRLNSQEFVEDLDMLGHPAWDLIPPNRYHPESLSGSTIRLPSAAIQVGRGCPFQCTFCSARSIDGHMPRKHSIPHVIEDIHLFHRKYGVREFKIMDDNFTIDKKYVLDFCNSVHVLGFDVVYSMPCGVHVNTLDDDILDALKTIGMRHIPVALESGSQRIVDAMRKNINLEDAGRKIHHIASKGFGVICYFMIGYKDETVDDIKKTIRLSLELPLLRAHFNSFCPFPGTEVFDQLKKEGRIKNISWHLQHFETVNFSFANGLDKATLTRWRIWALIRFYILRPSYGWKLLSQVKNRHQILFIIRKGLEFFGLWRYRNWV